VSSAWSVLPHDELVSLAENLWWVEGDLPNMSLRRSMTVARTDDGRLALHSAIALHEEALVELQSLGELTWLIVPNGWHRLDAAQYKARFPYLKVVCPAKAKAAVEKVVEVDSSYEELGELGPGVTLEPFEPNRSMEGSMVVRSRDGVTLTLTDSLFNLPHQDGMFWWFYGRVLGATGGPRITPITRAMLTFTRTRSGYKRWLKKWDDTGDVVRLIPGHGAVIHQAAPTLTQLANSL